MIAVNRSRAWAILVTLLVTVFCAGCSRQIGALASSPSPNSNQPLPFDRIPENSGVSPTQKLSPREIPSGTRLEVRAQMRLSSATSNAGDSFDAVLAKPVMLQNETVAPAGCVLRGVVTAVAPANGPGQPGYLRVTLSSIKIDGQDLRLKTSSVFAKGSSQSGQDDASFSTHRELRFALIEPIQFLR